MTIDEREEVFRSSNAGLRDTLSNQLAAHRSVNQRAVDLVKIDLLAASVTASGISLAGSPEAIPYLVASTLGFLYAIVSSVRVFRPRHFSRGLGPTEVDRIRQAVEDGMTPDVHYDQLMVTYRNAVASNSREFLTEASLFGNAVWASVAGVLFAATAAAAVLVSLPSVVALLAYVSIPAGCLLGKERYGFEENERL